MKLPYQYIVLEGNIGAGKTSLATRMANEFNIRLVQEHFSDNPFLPLFYENPQRHAFSLELFFLAERYQQLKDNIAEQDIFQQQTVSDYILSKSLVFAKTNLGESEFSLYHRLFHIIHSHIPKPDLLIYLHKDIQVLLKNISKRGRQYELGIESEYLKKIEEGYWEFFRQQSGYPILVIDTNDLDYVNNEEDYRKIISLLSKKYSSGIHRISFGEENTF
ncbi:MAG: deoxynucleoside kinase [Bacteroidia bacterium]|nr:deoxynucleoside kinase [Bacteroidia bacterium]